MCPTAYQQIRMYDVNSSEPSPVSHLLKFHNHAHECASSLLAFPGVGCWGKVTLPQRPCLGTKLLLFPNAWELGYYSPPKTNTWELGYYSPPKTNAWELGYYPPPKTNAWELGYYSPPVTNAWELGSPPDQCLGTRLTHCVCLLFPGVHI